MPQFPSSVLNLLSGRHLLSVAFVVAGLSVSDAASAQDLGAQATRIEELLAAGNGSAARREARDFLRTVQRRSGFGVENVQLTVSPASGYGVFDPRHSRVYSPNEPVFAYVEVFGFSLTPGDAPLQAAGQSAPLADVDQEMYSLSGDVPVQNTMRFDVAFTLLSPQGEQLTPELIPMGEVELSTFAQPVDGYFTLTYRITGVSGEHIIYTEVTDRASGAQSSFRLPVTFVSDEAADRDAGALK